MTDAYVEVALDPVRATDLLKDEQIHLWGDLANDLRFAVNGIWSIAAETRAWRIARIARLVGPTPWGSMPCTLIAGGVYQAVLIKAGLEGHKLTSEELEQAERIAELSDSERDRLRMTAAKILSYEVNLEDDE